MSLCTRFAPPPALWFCCGVTSFFWKLLTKQYTWVDQPDMAFQVMPSLQFQAASWHRGEAPLWDPHEWGGQPLVGQLQPGAAYPLNWPLFLTGRLWPNSLGRSQELLHYGARLRKSLYPKGSKRNYSSGTGTEPSPA